MGDDKRSMLDLIAWPVRTERLAIRRCTVDDAHALFEIRRLEEVSRWLSRWITDEDEFVAFCTAPGRLAKTLIVELDGRIIGDLMLQVEDAWAQGEVADEATNRQAELGWALDPAFAGNGYATEAARALLRVCFTDLDIHRVYAQCFADNEPSWRLMERLGMRREMHSVRDSLHRDGRWLDAYSYAILADEWRPDGETGRR